MINIDKRKERFQGSVVTQNQILLGKKERRNKRFIHWHFLLTACMKGEETK